MKSECGKLSFSGSGGAANFASRGKNSVELLGADGTPLLIYGRVQCGKFSELSALPERFRRHLSHSGLEVEVESSGVIPFGCEYRISRRTVLSDGVALITTDVAAVNGGKVGDIQLENVEFPGPWESVEFMVFGEKELHRAVPEPDRELYAGTEPLTLLRCRRANREGAELVLGSDIWRHRASATLNGVSSGFRLVAEGGTLRLERRVLIYEPETEVEKRPWRFEAVLSWSRPETPVISDQKTLVSPGCFASKSTQRTLREAVRKSETPLCVCGGLEELCSDAAHLERPSRKALPHLAVDDAARFHTWANRQLAGRGLALTLAMPERGVLKDSIVMTNLGKLPERLTEQETQDAKGK